MVGRWTGSTEAYQAQYQTNSIFRQCRYSQYITQLLISDSTVFAIQFRYELFYEPYFLGPADMPRYDERFW